MNFDHEGLMDSSNKLDQKIFQLLKENNERRLQQKAFSDKV